MRVEFFLNGQPPSPPLGLVRARVEEGINHLSRLELLLASSRRRLDPEELLGQRVTLRLEEEGEVSRFDAVVTSLQRVDNPWGGEELYAYRLRASSAVVELELHLRSRVFRDLTVPQLLQQVLQEAGFQNGQDFTLKLLQEGSYRRREQVVQYQESDLAFLRRLMVREGMNFFFASKEEAGSAEMLMVVDDNAFFLHPFSRPLPYLPSRGLVSDQRHVSRFGFGQRSLPAHLALVAHDPHSPHTTHQARRSLPHQEEGTWEFYLGNAPEEVVEHGSRVESQALQAARQTGGGSSNLFRLRAGCVFALQQDPVRPNGAKYLAVRVSHHLRQEVAYALAHTRWEMEYDNRFQVVDAQAQYRPGRLVSLLGEEA